MSGEVLRDKAVVVTGAARGIGEQYARLCVALGASVVVSDVDGDLLETVANDLRSAGAKVESVVADISDGGDARRLVETSVSAFGRLDGLVNNAALHRREWFADLDLSAAKRMIDVNVFGTIACASAAAKVMRDQGSGSIVNVTSGAQCGLATQAVYSATKGAAASLTYALAEELRASGVRVNAISPLAATRMATDSEEFVAQNDGVANIKGHAGKTLPPPANNAAVVAYLLSDASAGITGQVVRVDDTAVSLMSHPAVIAATVRDGTDWSYDDIAREFADGLDAQLVPLGIVRL